MDRLLGMSLKYYRLYFTSRQSNSVEVSLFKVSLPKTIYEHEDWYRKELCQAVNDWIWNSYNHNSGNCRHWSEWKKICMDIMGNN